MKKTYKILLIIILIELCLTKCFQPQIHGLVLPAEYLLTLLLFVPIWLLCFLASKDEQLHKVLHIVTWILSWSIPLCAVGVGLITFFDIDFSALVGSV